MMPALFYSSIEPVWQMLWINAASGTCQIESAGIQFAAIAPLFFAEVSKN